jgi:hypothetical protein
VSIRNNRYQKETIFRIEEMVSIDSTDTYNFLSTDTKDCFCTSAILPYVILHVYDLFAAQQGLPILRREQSQRALDGICRHAAVHLG